MGCRALQTLLNTTAFRVFTSMYLIMGISLMTVLGAHTYQLVTLEATRIRLSLSPWGRPRGAEPSALGNFGQEALTREINRYRQQFMTKLEELMRKFPLLDAVTVQVKPFQLWLCATQCGSNVLFGAVVVGIINPLIHPVVPVLPLVPAVPRG